MFVRDPYERLFSGYIDKFFSPCIRTGEERKIIKLFRTDKTTTACHAGLSFTEFLLYVTNKGSMTVDRHYNRQYQVCLPCQADIDYIGKVETFQQDAEYILKEVAHIDPSEVFGASEDFEENSVLEHRPLTWPRGALNVVTSVKCVYLNTVSFSVCGLPFR